MRFQSEASPAHEMKQSQGDATEFDCNLEEIEAWLNLQSQGDAQKAAMDVFNKDEVIP